MAWTKSSRTLPGSEDFSRASACSFPACQCLVPRVRPRGLAGVASWSTGGSWTAVNIYSQIYFLNLSSDSLSCHFLVTPLLKLLSLLYLCHNQIWVTADHWHTGPGTFPSDGPSHSAPVGTWLIRNTPTVFNRWALLYFSSLLFSSLFCKVGFIFIFICCRWVGG